MSCAEFNSHLCEERSDPLTAVLVDESQFISHTYILVSISACGELDAEIQLLCMMSELCALLTDPTPEQTGSFEYLNTFQCTDAQNMWVIPWAPRKRTHCADRYVYKDKNLSDRLKCNIFRVLTSLVLIHNIFQMIRISTI